MGYAANSSVIFSRDQIVSASLRTRECVKRNVLELSKLSQVLCGKLCKDTFY